MSDRVRAWLCLIGVLALTAAWVLAGLLTPDFDQTRQSISQLQRDGAATAGVMTTGFVAFSAGAFAFAPLLPRLPRIALLVAAAATLGAALSPLGEVRGGRQDAVHLAFGASGYLALSLLPLLAARSLTGRARTASVAAGLVTSACLLGTVPADAWSGALQRVGFLVGHLWLAGAAVGFLRRDATLSAVEPDELERHLDAVLVGGQRPVVVELAEPDREWPQRFEEHRARILAALGQRVGQLEHVGSTAVPGLAAKPVIDVQLAVDDLDAAVDLLAAAGYVLRVREPGHRVVQAAPPLHAANVHLHQPGDPELAQVVRFRDRLRRDPEARRRYEEVKRSLAGRQWPDMNHYAEAKGPVIRELLAD